MHVRGTESTADLPDVVVGPSRRMWAVFEFLRVIASSESTVVITGESGTGKEVVARLIHRQSPRKYRPFIAVSCALYSETLIESELFGHERGAFTGAVRDRPGRFEQADGGTVLLDDVDDVPLSMQVKLLRVLQNRTIERLGGTKTTPVNVRVIAGTKRDLRAMVADGTFREDLFYRLNVLPVTLPPLRERLEDLPALIDHFFERSFRQRGEPVRPISAGVLLAFQRYDWPGNVRELENMCERMAQTNICGVLRTGCVAAGLMLRPTSPTQAVPSLDPLPCRSIPAAPIPAAPISISLDAHLRELERKLITWALSASDGNKSRAAELLQIKRSTLQDRMLRCQNQAAGTVAGAGSEGVVSTRVPNGGDVR